jgi:CRISPR-associated protein Cmr4
MTDNTNTGQQAASRMYWIHALTPLHVGAGRGLGFVDLPIVRETVTNFPYVPGSAVKGVLADHFGVTPDSRRTDPLHAQAFGRADDREETANSGSLVFTDAHLVCLPVRSLYGTFAWCSCPVVLARLKRDLLHAQFGESTLGKLPELNVASVRDDAALDLLVPSVEGDTRSALLGQSQAVYFEDLDFRARACPQAAAWAATVADWLFDAGNPWASIFQQRFAVVSDDVFSFLAESATQVDARVRIDEGSKTVADGALWYEESLPPEAVLAGIAWCGPVFGGGQRNDGPKRQNLLDRYCSRPAHLQLGGKATVGRGQVRVSFVSK